MSKPLRHWHPAPGKGTPLQGKAFDSEVGLVVGTDDALSAALGQKRDPRCQSDMTSPRGTSAGLGLRREAGRPEPSVPRLGRPWRGAGGSDAQARAVTPLTPRRMRAAVWGGDAGVTRGRAHRGPAVPAGCRRGEVTAGEAGSFRPERTARRTVDPSCCPLGVCSHMRTRTNWRWGAHRGTKVP